MKTREVHYTHYATDMVSSANQQYTLPEGYRWIRRGTGARVVSCLSYGLYWLIAQTYLRIFKGVRLRGRSALRQLSRGQGAFVYGNHTMTAGDAMMPVLCRTWKHNWAVCSPANFGVPVLGPLLKWVGAIPTGTSISQMRDMSATIRERALRGGVVTIYPEAHLWPYCTFIRPFAEGSFHYPAVTGLPSFSATTTYTRRRCGSKPRITVYYDGPFYPREELSAKERRRELAATVRDAMERRSRHSDYEYIKYIKDETE